MNNFDISYENATVVHSNKYNQNSGIIISNFFFSNLFQDVAFKLDYNNQEFSTTFKNLNLPLYVGQKIQLVAINKNVIAYIDKNKNEFYYLTNNLQRDLNYGIAINWTLCISLTFLFYFISASIPFLGDFSHLMPTIFLIPVVLWIYQRLINFLLEKKIDTLLTKN